MLTMLSSIKVPVYIRKRARSPLWAKDFAIQSENPCLQWQSICICTRSTEDGTLHKNGIMALYRKLCFVLH